VLEWRTNAPKVSGIVFAVPESLFNAEREVMFRARATAADECGAAEGKRR
jgi:hypothetical protein